VRNKQRGRKIGEGKGGLRKKNREEEHRRVLSIRITDLKNRRVSDKNAPLAAASIVSRVLLLSP
jgi:hypothetical protein